MLSSITKLWWFFQNSAIIAEFASLVAKAASESTGAASATATTSTTSSTTTTATTTTPSVQDNIKDKSLNATLSTNVINQASSQTISNSITNTVPIVTPSTTNTIKTTIDSQLNAQVDVSCIKSDVKKMSSLTKEFRPRNDAIQQSQKQQQQPQSIDQQKSTVITKETPVVPVHVERDNEKVSCPIPVVACPVSTIACEPVETNVSTKNNVTLPVQSTITNVATSDSIIIADPVVPVLDASKGQHEQIVCEKVIQSSTKTTETHKSCDNNADKSDEESTDGEFTLFIYLFLL